MASLNHLLWRTPAVIGHRGASAAAPENTLAAFQRAVELGADAVELDVKLSRDGALVIMHDETVDRTTDGKGKVCDLTLADFKRLDAGSWKGPQFAGERVPTLAEVFEAVGQRLWINVELTNYYAGRDNLVPAVVGLIQKMSMQRRVLLSSFDPFNLRRARQLDASLPLAQLTSHDMARYLREAWLAPLCPHDARHPDVAQLKQKGVAWYHRRHYRVNVWTDNDPGEMREFVRQGVDGLITDVPDVARAVATAA
jgi:glycerophosphoryl diester phosphodiesterase